MLGVPPSGLARANAALGSRREGDLVCIDKRLSSLCRTLFGERVFFLSKLLSALRSPEPCVSEHNGGHAAESEIDQFSGALVPENPLSRAATRHSEIQAAT